MTRPSKLVCTFEFTMKILHRCNVPSFLFCTCKKTIQGKQNFATEFSKVLTRRAPVGFLSLISTRYKRYKIQKLPSFCPKHFTIISKSLFPPGPENETEFFLSFFSQNIIGFHSISQSQSFEDW